MGTITFIFSSIFNLWLLLFLISCVLFCMNPNIKDKLQRIIKKIEFLGGNLSSRGLMVENSSQLNCHSKTANIPLFVFLGYIIIINKLEIITIRENKNVSIIIVFYKNLYF